MNALRGCKVLDFTRLLPGPMCTHMLGQMGADVLKVESPSRQDTVRYSHPVLYNSLNHNKTHATIDYTTAEGKDAIMHHVESTDVLIEQFRPGAMEAWGLGYEALKSVNPDLIYVSMTGYGQKSSMADRAGHDLNYLAISGLLSQNIDALGRPTVPGFQLADVCGGSYMAIIAIQAALLQRHSGGSSSAASKGVHVDVDLTAAVTPLLTLPASLSNTKTGCGETLAPFTSDGKPNIEYLLSSNILDGKTVANYSVYETGDGKYMAVGAFEPKFWARTCEILDKREWILPQHKLFLHLFPGYEELCEIFKTKTRDEWASVFENEDVCITPVLELHEIATHPYHSSRGTFEEIDPTTAKLAVDSDSTAAGDIPSTISDIKLPFEFRV